MQSWSTNKLDLLPSRLELAWSLKQPGGKEQLLKDFLDQVADDYHLIPIDCAPTESVLTSAAYFAADQVVVPVKPEFLSTIGLPLLATSMKDHNALPGAPQVAVTAIVFNHASDYHPEEALAKQEVHGVAKTHGWPALPSEVPYSRSFPKGAREGKPLRTTSYARKAQKAKLTAVTERLCEGRRCMNDRGLDLLNDLVRLLKRYGPDEFKRLSTMLSDPSLVESLRAVLDRVPAVPPKRPERAEKESADSVPDPNLDVLRSRLSDPAAYPHVRDLMDEARRLGVHIPPAGFKSRKDAVGAVVRHFRSVLPTELAAAVERLHVGDRRGSLQEWSSIIMDRKR